MLQVYELLAAADDVPKRNNMGESVFRSELVSKLVKEIRTSREMR